MAAVRAEDAVAGPQVSAHAGGDGLLADIGVAGAEHQPALMAAGQFLLGLSDHLHRAIEGEPHVGRGSVGHRGLGRFRQPLCAGWLPSCSWIVVK